MSRVYLLWVPILLLVAACRSHEDKIYAFRTAYVDADFARADRELDLLIAKEAKVEVELVERTCALDYEVDVEEGDTSLYMMEKSFVQLGMGNLDCSLDLLRRVREYLDPRLADKNVGAYFGSLAVDDAVVEFAAADYEHVLVRTMLAIIDLLMGGDDAYAYAIQIDQKQEEILGSPFGLGLTSEDGEDISYSPASQYDRVAIGAYLVGVVQESQRDFDEASKAYARALEWSGGVGVIDSALRETNGDVRPPEGAGLVHVFYLGGSGPQLAQGTAPITDLALSLAKWVSIFQTEYGIGTLGQAPIPVPVVAPIDPVVPPLWIRSEAGEARTELLLDVNVVAQQQLEANMPWIVARGIVRRALKTAAVDAATEGARRNDQGWGNFLGLLANVVVTVGERADTRNWTTLPSQFQVARLYLEEGVHSLDFGVAGQATLSVRRGGSSFVVVLQPNLELPAAIQVDRLSRVEVETPIPMLTEP